MKIVGSLLVTTTLALCALPARAASDDIGLGVTLGSGYHSGVSDELSAPLSFDIGAFGRYGLNESLAAELSVFFYALSGRSTLSSEIALAYRWDVLRWVPQLDLGFGYQLPLQDGSAAVTSRLGGGIDYLYSRNIWLGVRYHLLLELSGRVIGPSHRLSLRLEHAF